MNCLVSIIPFCTLTSEILPEADETSSGKRWTFEKLTFNKQWLLTSCLMIYLT